MKKTLKWAVVSEESLQSNVAPEGYDGCYSQPVSPKILIDAEHPQEGLFPPNFEAYMQYWPVSIERPVSIVVTQNYWEWSTFHNRYEGTVETEPDFGPETVLTMPNGAKFILREIDPSGDEAPEEIFEGDWSAYGDPGSDGINEIIDVVTEAYAISVNAG